MNREWVLGARSVISSDSIIHRCKTSCILNALGGSEGDVLWQVVLGAHEVTLVVTDIPVSKRHVKRMNSIVSWIHCEQEKSNVSKYPSN